MDEYANSIESIQAEDDLEIWLWKFKYKFENQKSFFRHKVKQSLAYKVSLDNNLLAAYQISLVSISLKEDSDTTLNEFYEDTPRFGFLMIDYLAVDRRVHGQGDWKYSLILYCSENTYIKWGMPHTCSVNWGFAR